MIDVVEEVDIAVLFGLACLVDGVVADVEFVIVEVHGGEAFVAWFACEVGLDVVFCEDVFLDVDRDCSVLNRVLLGGDFVLVDRHNPISLWSTSFPIWFDRRVHGVGVEDRSVLHGDEDVVVFFSDKHRVFDRAMNGVSLCVVEGLIGE